jgi:hypothetical protein
MGTIHLGDAEVAVLWTLVLIWAASNVIASLIKIGQPARASRADGEDSMAGNGIVIGGLWKKDTKIGQLLTGSLSPRAKQALEQVLQTTGEHEFVIFPAREKRSERDPDFSLTVQPKRAAASTQPRRDPGDEDL